MAPAPTLTTARLTMRTPRREDADEETVPMSHSPTRYIEPAVLVRRRFGHGDAIPKWDAAVLCFRGRGGSATMVEALGAEPLGRKVLWGMDANPEFPAVYSTVVGGRSVAVVTRCLWGGPQAAILVEELAVLGVRQILGFGVAGSLDPQLKQGEQIAIAQALPSCGASACYGPGPYEASGALLERADGFVQVTGASVDAVYRETPAHMGDLRRQGAQAINMEVSAFYAAGAACALQCLWTGYISDMLTDRWHDWYIDRREMNRRSAELCVSLLKQLW